MAAAQLTHTNNHESETWLTFFFLTHIYCFTSEDMDLSTRVHDFSSVSRAIAIQWHYMDLQRWFIFLKILIWV